MPDSHFLLPVPFMGERRVWKDGVEEEVETGESDWLTVGYTRHRVFLLRSYHLPLLCRRIFYVNLHTLHSSVF